MCDPRTSFEKIANHFDKTRRKAWDEVLEFASDLEENSVIVDIGCGNMRNALSIAKCERNKNFKFICMDISKAMVKISKNKVRECGDSVNHQFFFIIADGKNTPLKEKTVDAVLSIAVFHHLKNKDAEKFAYEIHRILKEKGKLLLSVWKKDQILKKKHKKISENEILTFWGVEKVPIYYRIVLAEELAILFGNLFSEIEIWEDDRNIWLEGKK